ncbi:AraC family transcriptional regulator [Paenibacillus sp. P36]|uniref:AraC family transcriptional regulator n=1 Tax=Paenibacillus sp. P36 TaxID=3342538 RepID=UPI0038B3087B
MLTVVLADDDCLVTEILNDTIPWHDLGIQVVGIADHGRKALDLCLELRPDILVTDIQMPFCNGLEVAMELMEHDIPTKIILISGVQDFNYARLALNVKATGYILKPIQLKEVTSVLKKARDTIEMEFQREQVIQRLTSQLSENMSLMRDKFLTNLIFDGMESNDELQERLVYFDLPFQISEDITVAVAKMDEYEQRVRKEGVERVQFFNFSIKNIIEQTLNNFQAGICFSTKDNEFVIIFGEEYGYEDKMTPIFEGIEQLLIGFEGISLSIGIGNCVSVKTANLSYRCACNAVSYKFYTGNNSIIHINDIIDSNTIDKMSDLNHNARLNELQKFLLVEIKLGESMKTMALFEEYYALLSKVNQFSQEYIRGRFLELVIDAHREICETEDEVEEVNATYMISLQAIMRGESISAIKPHASKMLICIADYYSAKYNKKHNNLVERIKRYVNRNFKENISLAEIASEVFMSPTYICAVFKRETGQTINEYIIEMKMNDAKKMLASTKMKIMDISEDLGYENSQYFSYSFKKYLGETPQQYRNRFTQKA